MGGITSDPIVVSKVSGCAIDFQEVPQQQFEPKPLIFNAKETEMTSVQISRVLKHGIIEECDHASGEFISQIFVGSKRNGSCRIIRNLKQLSKLVKYHHFKMDTIQSCINLTEEDAFLASIDLKDAYYSIPVALSYRNCLKFRWDCALYRYTCLPHGLACSRRYFMKIMKAVLSELRKRGNVLSGYLDDFFFVGSDLATCRRNVEDALYICFRTSDLQ